jgi:hypothetical protein
MSRIAGCQPGQPGSGRSLHEGSVLPARGPAVWVRQQRLLRRRVGSRGSAPGAEDRSAGRSSPTCRLPPPGPPRRYSSSALRRSRRELATSVSLLRVRRVVIASKAASPPGPTVVCGGSGVGGKDEVGPRDGPTWRRISGVLTPEAAACHPLDGHGGAVRRRMTDRFDLVPDERRTRRD